MFDIAHTPHIELAAVDRALHKAWLHGPSLEVTFFVKWALRRNLTDRPIYRSVDNPRFSVNLSV
jgi:hypothetical protein